MISEQNLFDLPIERYLRTFDNIQKIPTVQGDNFTTGRLLDYPFSKIIIKR